MVFITAGMGGGTGTGAAPVVAEIAKAWAFSLSASSQSRSGLRAGAKCETAEAGIEEMKGRVDSLVVIPNGRLKHVVDQKITMMNAFILQTMCCGRAYRAFPT